MAIDDKIRRLCNLLEMSPTFVGLERVNDEGEVTEVVIKEANGEIQANTGMYWAAGQVITKHKISYPLVVQVSTDDSGEVYGAYWKIDGKWCKQNDKEFKKAIGDDIEAIFPVYFKLNVQFEGGIEGGSPQE